MVQYKLILESNRMKGEYFDRIDDLNKFTQREVIVKQNIESEQIFGDDEKQIDRSANDEEDYFIKIYIKNLIEIII